MNLDFPYVIVYSEFLCESWTKLLSSRRPVMGMAVAFNLIIMRDENHPMTPQWIVHEKIHHRQNWETLGLCQVIGFFEYWYARIVLKKSSVDSYFFKAQEQEAFHNQHNADYLKQRKFGAMWKYYWWKPVIGRDENYQVILDNKS